MIDNSEKWCHCALSAIFVMTLRKKVKVKLTFKNFNWAYITIKDTDLWLTMRNDVTVHYSQYLWWPWEIRSRSNWPSKISIGHTLVTIKDTDTSCLVSDLLGKAIIMTRCHYISADLYKLGQGLINHSPFNVNSLIKACWILLLSLS